MPPRRRRALPGFALVLLALLVASGAIGALAMGADPEEGSVSLESPRLTWAGKEFTAGGSSVSRQICNVPSDELCDEFTLTADIDPKHWETATGGAEVVIAWEDENDDFDLYVLDKSNAVVGSSANANTTSERVIITDANRDAGPYRVVVTPYFADPGSGYNGGVLVVDRADVGPATGDVPTEPVSDLPCKDGSAGGIFPCKDVDLESLLPVSVLNDGETEDAAGDPVELNDVWGWTDPETRREYAIVGKTTGTAFVDITDARAPKYLGSLPSSQRLAVLDTPVPVQKIWRDMKVYKDHAFIVAEEPAHGMQVFDLTRLRGVTEPKEWDEDTLYQRAPTVPGAVPNPEAMGNSHNIAINEESGFAYVIGTDTCSGGPHMIDIREPKRPKFAGCVAEDGYTHDNQCVNYRGPDQRFAGREICFNSNEDSLTIVDVTDKDNPVQLSREGYDGSAYTHQGWLTKDGRHFLVNDELDEQENGKPTTTRIFDVSKLDRPGLAGSYVAKVNSIDHNLYTKGDEVFEANYRSGLRILDASKAAEGTLTEKGFFDVYPEDDDAEFNGAWSNYPYYESGVVAVSGIEQGLFVVRPRTSAAPPARDNPAPETPAANPGTTPQPGAEPPAGNPKPTVQACSASAGLRSTAVSSSGSGLRLGFVRSLEAPVTVDVFKVSKGRSVIREQLVARFSDREESVRWNGRADRRGRKVGDGYYFARYRIRTAAGTETRRVTLQRKRGKFSRRTDFYRRATCDLLPSYKLERPVFGGRSDRPLGIAYKLARAARVTVTVTRGSRVVKRFSAAQRAAGRTHRLRLGAEGLPRGEYRVRLSARDASGTVSTTLASRRL